MQEGILYWITGLSGSGKTTIGNRLYYEMKKTYDNVVLLDGDILKEIVDENVGYSDEQRRKRAMKYAKICRMLTDQNIYVICCTVAMYDEVRQWNRENNKRYVEVFLDVPVEVLKERNQKGLYSGLDTGKVKNVSGMDLQVEFPKSPDITVINDGSRTVVDVVKEIMNFQPRYKSDFDRDTVYWNQYYNEKKAPTESSPFAQWVGSQVVKGRTLLDLGCGNGRDSLYFYKSIGMNVTAVDASNQAIEILKKQTMEDNIYFICDDFVCSTTIFAGQYDYCYSRFSLHAINESQETEVIQNVYKVLKEGGRIFIETRSVNDEIYGLGKCVGTDSYSYEGHFRRFLRKDNLLSKLIKAGFEIEYEAEERNFAPFEGSNPLIIRVVAKK